MGLRQFHILTVVGARPQFVKAAAVSRAIAANGQVQETLIHTGQHFDPGMSQVFFDELGLAEPAVNLDIHGGTHGEMTGRMLQAVERAITEKRPDLVLVPGDTTSTLAGALAAAKLHVPVAHLEAGLRSFNRRMPEEINRVLTDHVSALLFCPTATAVENLRREGVTDGVHDIGDVMYDATLFAAAAASRSAIIGRLGLAGRRYAVATVHRAESTDDPELLTGSWPICGTRRVIIRWFFHSTPALASGATKSSRTSAASCYASRWAISTCIACCDPPMAVFTDSGGCKRRPISIGFPASPCAARQSGSRLSMPVGTGYGRVRTIPRAARSTLMATAMPQRERSR